MKKKDISLIIGGIVISLALGGTIGAVLANKANKNSENQSVSSNGENNNQSDSEEDADKNTSENNKNEDSDNSKENSGANTNQNTSGNKGTADETTSSETQGDEIVASKPLDFEETEVGSNYVVLSWTPSENTNGLSGYSIYKDGEVVQKLGTEETSCKIEGLRSNTIYSFRIVANYSNGEVSKPLPVDLRTAAE